MPASDSSNSVTSASVSEDDSDSREDSDALEMDSGEENIPSVEEYRDFAKRQRGYRARMKEAENRKWYVKLVHILARYLPVLSWFPEFLAGEWRDAWKGDISAGLTVGVMLVPQGLAYALVAGLPPIYGLYASVVPIIIYAFLGTSKQLAVGPVAIVSLMVNEAITGGEDPLVAALGSEPTDDEKDDYVSAYVGYALAMAFLVGGIQFLMGVFRIGYVVNFLSHPVLSGFTSAAALIIAFSQMKHVFGTDAAKGSNFFETLINLFESFDDGVNGWTILMTVAALIILLVMKYGKQKKIPKYPKFLTFVPAPLVVVVLGVVVAVLADIEETAGVKIVGDVPSGMPPPSVPKLDEKATRLMTAAFAISIVGFMESVAVAKKLAEERGYSVDPSQELLALGVANIVGSFFSSYPVTGGFSRSAVNAQAGAVTMFASLLSVVVVIIALMLLSSVLRWIPKNTLAAIIFVAVMGLVDTDEVKHLWRVRKLDLLMWLFAFILTLGVGIELGILLAVGISLLIVIQRASMPHKAVLGRLGDTNTFRNVRRYPGAKIRAGLAVLRFDAPMFFANSESFKSTLFKLVWDNRHDAGLPHEPTKRHGEEVGDPRDSEESAGLPESGSESDDDSHAHILDVEAGVDAAVKPLRFVILDLSATNDLDSTAATALESILDFLRSYDIQLVLSSINGPVRDMLVRTGLDTKIRHSHMFWETYEAVDHVSDALDRHLADLPLRESETNKIFDYEEDEDKVPKNWLARQLERFHLN
jgi:sulfate permease, SulP family